MTMHVGLVAEERNLPWYNFRKNCLLAFIWTALVASYAWHLDYKYAFDPCELCLWLRIILSIGSGFFLLLAYSPANWLRSWLLLFTHIVLLFGLIFSLYLKMMIYSASFQVIQEMGIDPQTLACMNEDWRWFNFSLPDLSIFSYALAVVHAFCCFVQNNLD